MEFDLIVNRVLYKISIDVSWNIWNEDNKSWVTDLAEHNKVKLYAKDYLKFLSEYQ